MNRHTFIASIALVLGLSLVDAPAFASAEQMLEHLSKALEWRDHSRVRSEFHLRFQDADGGNVRESVGWSDWAESNGKFHLRLFSKRPGDPDEDGMMRYLIATPQFRLHWPGAYVQYSEAPSAIRTSVSVAMVFIEAGHFLSGRFLGGTEENPIVDLRNLHSEVKSGRLRLDGQVEHQLIEGLQCVVIPLRGEQIKLTLWLAPERGYNPVRVLIDTAERPDLGAGTQDLRGVTFIQDAQGRWLLESGTLSVHFPRYSKGRGRSGSYHVRRTHIETQPELNEKLFAIPEIPDGTEVILGVENERGELVDDPIRHHWKDGRPVPAFDPEAVERIRRRVQEAKRARERQD